MNALHSLAETVLKAALERKIQLACAESCTGGKIADALTDVPGASSVFRGGVVAYSVGVKQAVLGVPAETLERFGVVSRECAEAMARGAAKTLDADLAIATTGVAGPGSQDGIPAGTVCIALALPNGVFSQKCFFPNASREAVKELAVRAALEILLAQLSAE